MKRYCMTTIVGDGSEENPFRAKLFDLEAQGVQCQHVIAVAPSLDLREGRKKWVLAVVAASSQSVLNTLDNDPDVIVTPIGPEHLDNLWSSVPAQVRTRIRNKFQQISGITLTTTNSRTLRSIIREIGQTVDSNFDEANLDLTDPYVI